jgi:2-polyprenyl-3-methyl-5-hydroxy-6-metoxy-1,4-benzoquinol methylase
MSNNPIYDYDVWWNEYDEINRLDPGTRIRKQIIKQELNANEGSNILDLGCGSGELLFYLHKNLPKRNYYGADVSKKALSTLKKYKVVKDTYVLDLERDTQLKRKFDAIICSEVLEHIREWKNVISFLKKHSHQDSLVIITTQSGKRYPHHHRVGHIRHFKISQITTELEKNGFKVIKAYYMGWPFMNIKNLLLTYVVGNKNYEEGKISKLSKLVLSIFYYLYLVSLRYKGPQIIITAVKE